ncbi:citrate lyase subunit beta [Pseudovibrio ascidiaceicola]|uniref:citrate lyase subunit beta n=1 Tax=Pseudovibrio ascidiaceicola TaxID=285279 RepID=UPI003D35D30D
MNCLFKTTASAIAQSKDFKAHAELAFAILPEKPAREFEPYGSPEALAKLSKQNQVYFVLNDPSENIILSTLKPYTAVKQSGVVSTFLKSRADIERLHTILSVYEAEHGLQDGSLKIITEFGRYPAALNTLTNLNGASPRISVLCWNEEVLKIALGAKLSRDEKGQLLPPFEHARTQCLFAARAAHMLPLDTAVPAHLPPAKMLELIDMVASQGFSGKTANSPEEANLIQQVFTAQ